MKNEELFSQQSDWYAKFRPTYPPELYAYILSYVTRRQTAWDCGTGNGQAATILSGFFEKVLATDISPEQISKANRLPNIEYLVSNEQVPFDSNTIDLITIAQAYHWLDWPGFYREANRVGTRDCVVAAWNYTCFYTGDADVDQVIDRFHNEICGPYWDERRRYVEEKLETVSFDFEPLPSRVFRIDNEWLPEQVLGYFNSWSAVQQYIRKNGESPIDLIREELIRHWGANRTRPIHFPVYLRLGRVVK